MRVDACCRGSDLIDSFLERKRHGACPLFSSRHFTDGQNVVENLAEIVRFERNDTARPRQNPCRLANLGDGNRANRAKLLGKDNFGINLPKQLLVDAIQAVGRMTMRADCAVDLRATQS